jgi:hypothetical protein
MRHSWKSSSSGQKGMNDVRQHKMSHQKHTVDVEIKGERKSC